jgi:hypothetical protein
VIPEGYGVPSVVRVPQSPLLPKEKGMQKRFGRTCSRRKEGHGWKGLVRWYWIRVVLGPPGQAG